MTAPTPATRCYADSQSQETLCGNPLWQVFPQEPSDVLEKITCPFCLLILKDDVPHEVIDRVERP